MLGLPINFNCRPFDASKPTLVAHQVHLVPFNFGFKMPYPSSLSEFDPDAVNMRMELWTVNRILRSWRASVLVAILASAGKPSSCLDTF